MLALAMRLRNAPSACYMYLYAICAIFLFRFIASCMPPIFIYAALLASIILLVFSLSSLYASLKSSFGLALNIISSSAAASSSNISISTSGQARRLGTSARRLLFGDTHLRCGLEMAKWRATR